MLPTIAFISGIGPWEVAVVLVVALLIFGRRLPEVGRSLGKGIVEFKKGLQGIEEDIEGAGKDGDKVNRNETKQLSDEREREADFDNVREKNEA